MEDKTCLFFIPYAAPGHQIPMIEVVKRLLEHNSLSITFLLMKPPILGIASNISTSYLESIRSLNLPINFINLPSVKPPAHFNGPKDFVTNYMKLHLPHVRAAVASSPLRVVGFVLDLFATALIDLAYELEISSYIFFASNAAFLALMLHLPTLDQYTTLCFSEMDREINVPGLPPIPPLSIPTMLMNKKSPFYTSMVYHGRRFMEAKGIIINSNIILEARVLKAVAEGQCTPGKPGPIVYPIGPIISIENGSNKHESVKWLDMQPSKTVIFLCFGTGGGFEMPQLREIAKGLECSGCRFLWAIKQRVNGQLGFPTQEELDEILPEGFEERTKERGLVWNSWAPQSEILAHQAVCGFITHCGWNSCLESLWFGVPMIVWPLYAEQSLNAFVMVNDMGVAVDLKLDAKNNDFVNAGELKRAIICLIDNSEEGKTIKTKVKDMKVELRKAVQKGGPSYSQLQGLAKEFGKLK